MRHANWKQTVSRTSTSSRCEKSHDRRCKNCVLRGHACSWTYVGDLFGPGHTYERSGPGKETYKPTERTKMLIKAFFHQPYNRDACSPVRISPPGFVLRHLEEDREELEGEEEEDQGQ